MGLDYVSTGWGTRDGEKGSVRELLRLWGPLPTTVLPARGTLPHKPLAAGAPGPVSDRPGGPPPASPPSAVGAGLLQSCPWDRVLSGGTWEPSPRRPGAGAESPRTTLPFLSPRACGPSGVRGSGPGPGPLPWGFSWGEAVLECSQQQGDGAEPPATERARGPRPQLSQSCRQIMTRAHREP